MIQKWILFFSIMCTALASEAFTANSAIKTGNIADFTLSSGDMQVEWLSEDIVRVRYTTDNTLPGSTDLILENYSAPSTINWSLNNGASTIDLSSAKLKVSVNKSNGVISYIDIASGTTVLKEAPTNHKNLFNPRTVQSEANVRQGRLAFESKMGEGVFGFGQHQDSVMNRAAVPAQNAQQNVKIALPFFWSTEGYGVLLNNHSMTEINIGQQQTLSNKMINYTASKTGKHGIWITDTRFGHNTEINAKDSGPFSVIINGTTNLYYKNFWAASNLGTSIDMVAGQTYQIKIDAPANDIPTPKVYINEPGIRSFEFDVADLIDYCFILGSTPKEIIAGYREISGDAPLLPKKAYGFWQSREAYRTQAEITTAAQQYRSRNIPADIIVQDWNFWVTGQNARVFDPARYPDPAQMCTDLHNMNFLVMASVWAKSGSVTDPNYRLGQSGNGSIDPYTAYNRNLWWEDNRDSLYNLGIDSFWHDGTEPEYGALYNTSPNSTIGRRVLNSYGTMVCKGTYEGQMRDFANKRPVTLSRSAWSGIQRYNTVCWSGDISGTWQDYKRQIPAGLNFCMGGVPYWCTDTGGFFRKASLNELYDGIAYSPDQYSSPDFQELLMRWMQYSTFSPIQRVHGNGSNTEIWKYGAEVEAAMRDMIDLRYRLIPYIYSEAWKVTNEGDTLMRPLAYDFPTQSTVYDIADQYMFGPAFMACPVTERGLTSRSVYLPSGTSWTDFWTGDVHSGGQTITAAAPKNRLPVFVRSGSIIPMGPKMQYIGEKDTDPTEIRIYTGADGSFTLYEDEGNNNSYATSSAYSEIPFTWNQNNTTLTIGARSGSFPGMLSSRTFKLVIVQPGNGIGIPESSLITKEISYTGSQQIITLNPPTADIQMDKNSGALPLTIQFDGTGSTSPNGIASYQWDFNDDGVIDSYISQPTWTYNFDKTVTVKLIVTSTSGISSVKTATITAGTGIDQGLQGWYRMDATSGDLAVDWSGYGRHGTIGGTKGGRLSSGKFGGAYDVENNGYIDIPSSVFTKVTADLTVTFWSHDLGRTLAYNNAFAGLDAGGNEKVKVHLPWTTDVVLRAGGQGINKTTTLGEVTGGWHHWAFVVKGGTGEMEIYRNGSLWHNGSSAYMSGISGITNFMIGNKPGDTGNGFQGALDDFRIYSTALSASEISAVYAEVPPVTTTLPPLAPSDIQLDNNVVYENQNAGETVGNLSASDPNQGDTITYALVDDAGGRFAVAGSQIQIGTTSLSDGTFTIDVKATDSSGLIFVKQLDIVVRPAGSILPSDISSCVLWLDGDDLDGDGNAEGTGEDNLSGTQISQWKDKSGKGNHASATGSEMPSLVTNGLNNRTTVLFDGTDDSVSFPSITGIRTVYWVLKDADSNMSGTQRFILGHSADYHFHRGFSTLWDGNTSSSIKNGVVKLNGSSFNGQTSDLPYNTWCTFSVETTAGVSASKLSGDRSYGRYWLGEFAELIIFNTELTPLDKQNIESYLTNKWFVATAPVLTFNQWKTNKGVTGNNSGALEDFDSDGINNFVEFAFALEPNQQSTLPATHQVDASGNITYHVPNLRDGVTYKVQTTTNLINKPWATQQTLQGNTGGSITDVQLPSSLAPNGKLYVRLWIEE